MIYLDHCATTPLAEEARAAMEEAWREWMGNPSSVHGAGRRARVALEAARRRVAAAIGAPAESAVLTASGSESNNLALKGVALARAGSPTHLIVSAIEHDSILKTVRYLTQRFDWIEVSEIRPDAGGQVDPVAIERAIRPETCLISVMHANNETGVIQPVGEIARLARRRGILMHTDAAQSFGRTAVDAAALGCDLLSLAAHKFYGPRGAGVLYVRPGLRLDPLVHGGSQEGGRRAGTENLPAAAGMAAAAERAVQGLEGAREHLRRLEKKFLQALREAHLIVETNGRIDDKVPGVLNIAVRGVAQVDLVVGMDLAGVAISAGSACSSGVVEPSHVLQAMGLAPWRVDGGVRISFGRGNTETEAAATARAMIELCRRLAPEAVGDE